MPAIPTPRPDNSGGFMVLNYSNGQDTHRARFHLQDFNVNGQDLVYSVPGNQTEADVQATFTALAAKWAAYYGATWSISLYQVYRNMGADPNRAGYNLFQELFNFTVPAAVAGSGGDTTTAQQRSGMIIHNFRTVAGGRSRVIWMGSGLWSANSTQQVVANSAGDLNQQLVAYLSGAATGIVGHDGAKLVTTAHQTNPYNRRLRRRYNQA